MVSVPYGCCAMDNRGFSRHYFFLLDNESLFRRITEIMFIEKLSNAFGVSGNEDEVRTLIEDEIKDSVDSIETDSIGNLITYKSGKKRRPKVMLAAHMDEVGFMITNIEKDGWLKFNTVGGIDDRVLPSKVVMVGDKKIRGVIGIPPPHLTKKSERDKVIKIKDLRIDIGAKNKEDAEKYVKTGDYATFATNFSRMENGLIKGKAFDDRIGCAILTELLKDTYPFALYGVFTVQEEVGLRGATVAAYRVEPEVAFVLEGTAAGDFPIKKDLSKAAHVGKGTVVTHMDRSVICDKELVSLLINIAEKNGIPYQFKRPMIGGTDAGKIRTTKSGTKAAVLSVPLRYIHSPVSIASLSDIENTKRLISLTLRSLK